jgi:hypothetical protein
MIGDDAQPNAARNGKRLAAGNYQSFVETGEKWAGADRRTMT